MQSITVYPENPADFELLKSMLEKMQIPFENCEEQDFALTEEMKKLLDARLALDKDTAVDAREFLRTLATKHGVQG